MDRSSVVDDLAAEYAELDEVVAMLDGPAWDTPTPADGWAVRDQIFHLGYGDELAALAATDHDAFNEKLAELMADLDAVDTIAGARARRMSPAELLAYWRTNRDTVLGALRRAAPDARIPWVYGTLSVASFATARLMETWAHGHDVVEALGVRRTPTDRLRHIARLGVMTRGFSYHNNGLEPPDGDVLVELDAPSGSTWTWGESAHDRVAGPAEDFCLVVTQRRHPADTRLQIQGPLAVEWLDIAQAFAGSPTRGPAPATPADS